MITSATAKTCEEETANKGLRKNLSIKSGNNFGWKENKIIWSNPTSFSKQGSKIQFVQYYFLMILEMDILVKKSRECHEATISSVMEQHCNTSN